jgi:alpha-ketoglutarate-dependent taurine dioxygenase
MLRRTWWCRLRAPVAFKLLSFDNDADTVRMTLDNGSEAVVCREWVLDNCSSRRHQTGQKTSSSATDLPPYAELPHIVSASVSRDSSKKSSAVFLFSNGKTVSVDALLCSKYAAGKSKPVTSVPLPSVEHLHRVNYASFVDTTSDAHVDALERLARDAIILIQECPPTDSTVLCAAHAIDAPMHTLYGQSWHVESAPRKGPKNNIAYTSEELDLHQDLVYHESMPGIQLLHCQKFDKRCVGGESTFLDVIHAAEMFRKSNPDDFRVLCEVPAAFMKDDLDRPVPAQYYYATPHLHCGDGGEKSAVVKVFWSPAFEAPTPPHPKLAEYFRARRNFAHAIEQLKTSPLYLVFKLKEGDCVVFHQSRLLHGRKKFSEPEAGSRRLHGAYVNVDAFRNAVVTRMGFKGRSVDSLPLFANGSWR